MSRSLHTDPIDLRAARRMAAPLAPRRAHDHRRRRRPTSRAWRHGASLTTPLALATTTLPRILELAPGSGYRHAISKADVLAALRALPARYRYKLERIELRPPPAGMPHAWLLGQTVLPGRVILYAQPESPWLLAGTLSSTEEQRLAGAGAQVSTDRRACITLVDWPGETLAHFMLQQVLPHELMHHALQVRRRRGGRRAVRDSDHEAVANLAAPRSERV